MIIANPSVTEYCLVRERIIMLRLHEIVNDDRTQILY